jgi:hypothetical protein
MLIPLMSIPTVNKPINKGFPMKKIIFCFSLLLCISQSFAQFGSGRGRSDDPSVETIADTSGTSEAGKFYYCTGDGQYYTGRADGHYNLIIDYGNYVNSVRYAHTYTVSASGKADYTKLSTALAAITDAGAYKRYCVEVYGRILESSSVSAKSYIDVIGFGAEVVDSTDNIGHAVAFSNITNTTWKNLIIRRKGAPATYSSAYGAILNGTLDQTVVLQGISVYNEVTTYLDRFHGIQIIGTGNPLLYDVYAKGSTSAANNTRGFYIAESAHPRMFDCVGEGGGTTADSLNHGIIIHENAYPEMNNCTGIGGNGNRSNGIQVQYTGNGNLNNCIGIAGATGQRCAGLETVYSSIVTVNGGFYYTGEGGQNCYGIHVIGASSPRLYNVYAGTQRKGTNWLYDDANSGRFSPTTTQPWQLFAIVIEVEEGQTGKTLSIGTTASGTNLVNAQSIATTGGQYSFSFEGTSIASGAYIYATPSGAVADGVVKIYYVYAINNKYCYALREETTGYPQYNNCTFVSNGASEPAFFEYDVTYYRQVNNCFFRSAGRSTYDEVRSYRKRTDDRLAILDSLQSANTTLLPLYSDPLYEGGDFETTFTGGVTATGWTKSRGTTYDSSLTTHSYIHCQALTNPAGNNGYMYRDITSLLTAGYTYRINFWGKAYAGTGGLVNVVGEGGSVVTGTANHNVTASSWTGDYITFTPDAADITAHVYIDIYANTNAVAGTNGLLVDDLQLVRVLSEPLLKQYNSSGNLKYELSNGAVTKATSIKLGAGITCTLIDTVCTPGGAVRWGIFSDGTHNFWAPVDTALVK